MTKLTFLSGPDCGDVGSTAWNGVVFPANVPVELDPSNPAHAHMIGKARGNRFFAVEDGAQDADLEALRALAREAGVKSPHLYKDPDKLMSAIESAGA